VARAKEAYDAPIGAQKPTKSNQRLSNLPSSFVTHNARAAGIGALAMYGAPSFLKIQHLGRGSLARLPAEKAQGVIV
jgi:hypothetical protein